MKESLYNVCLEHLGKRYVFNSMTCALAEINEDYDRALQKVKDGVRIDDEGLFQSMLQGGFVVDDEVDELEALKLRNLAGKFSEHGFGLTIAPTLQCNFACPYCYESPAAGVMEDDVADAIVAFVEQKAHQQKPIQVSWYGGEPLLAIDKIETLSSRLIDACEDAGVPYGAYIVTNGFLLSDDVISILKRCRINGAQITVDGPKDVHDSRRVLKAGNAGTFDVILHNLERFVQAGLTPDIRINVDRTNSDRVSELLALLAEWGLTTCKVSFGQVTAYTSACSSVEGACLDTCEYAMQTLEYQKLLLQHGFEWSGYPLYPGIKGNYCCADSSSAYVVDPAGNLYKCWNDIGVLERSVGNILDVNVASALQQRVQRDYLLWSPFDHQECRACKLLPICMGGCPYNGLRHGGSPECEKWKYNLEQSLTFLITNEKRMTSSR